MSERRTLLKLQRLLKLRPLSNPRPSLNPLFLSILAPAILGGVACSEGSSGDPDPSNGGAGGSSPGGSRFGSVAVEIREATETREAATIATGRIYDRKPIPLVPLVVTDEAGDCQLLIAQLPACTEPCPSGTLCVDEDKCAPYPRAQDVGVLRVEGLGSETVRLDPFPPSYDYQSDPLPYPACQEGAQVRLEGDNFSAETTCIAPLVVPSEPPLVRREQPVVLTWEPPEHPELGRIHVRLDVSHHGGKKGEIFCDTADTGSLEIPSVLVTPLVDQGLAGFPSVFVTRVSRVTTEHEPGVSFQVSSTVERPVDTGVLSCLKDEDCPEGQVCDRELVLCAEP